MRPITVLTDTGVIVRTTVQRRTRCGKQGYSSRKVAAATAKAESRRSGETIHAYHCGTCHAFHIGHPIGSRVA